MRRRRDLTLARRRRKNYSQFCNDYKLAIHEADRDTTPYFTHLNESKVRATANTPSVLLELLFEVR
jgi:hypothetical protein